VAFFTNIIHRFGVPNSIITDNGTQFTGRKFLDFCEDHHIRVEWAAVAHPMMNGQVERANDMILQGLKPRIYNDLNKFGRRWMKELPSVVSHPALRNKARCISYMRQEDNIYNNRVYRDKCHNNQSIYYVAEDLLQNKRINIKRTKDRRR
jgi:transposase InsO family protein